MSIYLSIVGKVGIIYFKGDFNPRINQERELFKAQGSYKAWEIFI